MQMVRREQSAARDATDEVCVQHCGTACRQAAAEYERSLLVVNSGAQCASVLCVQSLLHCTAKHGLQRRLKGYTAALTAQHFGGTSSLQWPFLCRMLWPLHDFPLPLPDYRWSTVGWHGVATVEPPIVRRYVHAIAQQSSGWIPCARLE